MQRVKKLLAFSYLSSLFFYLSIFIFIISFNFTDTPPPQSGWYQQWMPNLGGKQINDITFLDSLTGFAVASRNVNPDTSSILKTTNGGDNWQIVFTQGSRRYSRVIFINSHTGFISGGSGTGTPYLYKTTDGGNNWTTVPGATLGNAYWKDMSVLSNDTIWLVEDDPLTGGAYRTTNGGISWERMYNNFSFQPDKIYMYNSRIGFICKTGTTQLIKTTDGGESWNLISGIGSGSFNDIYFTDSLTGWKAKSVGGGGWLMGKTTDGGFNWIEQALPSGGNISLSGIVRFCNINKDTIWGVGGVILQSGLRGMIDITTNGGDNWLFQVPMTDTPIYRYFHTKFINKLIGWAYSPITGVHTVTGGDTISYAGIKQISNIIPKGYQLFQNYPNPFNSNSKIKYQITNTQIKDKQVLLIVYNSLGQKVQTLVNEVQGAGIYEAEFDGTNYPSGVYFYSLYYEGKLIDTKKMLLVK